MLFTSEDARRLIESGEVESVGTDSPIWLGVPLKTPNGPIGVLVVQDYEHSDTYTQRDVELLTSVADQIAIAIERKRNEEALR
ncbi:GAF domain-containing protein, partial [Escherichia coli]|nr:GAF domain-containing protein [Escherichia coli]